MSLITIIAKTPRIVSWENLHDDITKTVNLNDIDVFPIPKELGFNENAIGIAVPRNYRSRENVISELIVLIKLLSSLDFELVELFSGEVITNNNAKNVFKSLLPN